MWRSVWSGFQSDFESMHIFNEQNQSILRDVTSSSIEFFDGLLRRMKSTCQIKVSIYSTWKWTQEKRVNLKVLDQFWNVQFVPKLSRINSVSLPKSLKNANCARISYSWMIPANDDFWFPSYFMFNPISTLTFRCIFSLKKHFELVISKFNVCFNFIG